MTDTIDARPETEPSGADLRRDVADAVSTARAAFATGRTALLPWRAEQLDALARMLTEHTEAIHAAVGADLGRSPVEAHLSEVSAVVSEARRARRHLRRWTRPRRVRASLAFGRTRAFVQREPLGTVLVIGPWNYPVHLLLMPLVGALAAGNSVVLKPSEVAPQTSALLTRLVPRYLDREAVRIVEGGVEVSTALLEHRFDHIFYTGNGTVGSIVLAAAAPHLTPVTLELGGKSPVWVDDSVDLEKAARTIAWGKFSNCGQTCVAPDHVLTTPEIAPRLAELVAAAITEYYGEDPRTSPDYGRIVNERHARRVAALLDSGRAVAGGSADPAQRYVAPTVLLDVAPDSPVMQEEIFGPILPILTVPDLAAAVDAVNSRPKPLALYAFTERADVREQWLSRTSSGGVAFNTVMLQVGVDQLPFGGVGGSGMGAYHGEASVRCFSHERSVLRALAGPNPSALSRPPFTERKRRLLVRG